MYIHTYIGSMYVYGKILINLRMYTTEYTIYVLCEISGKGLDSIQEFFFPHKYFKFKRTASVLSTRKEFNIL